MDGCFFVEEPGTCCFLFQVLTEDILFLGFEAPTSPFLFLETWCCDVCWGIVWLMVLERVLAGSEDIRFVIICLMCSVLGHLSFCKIRHVRCNDKNTSS